MKTRSVIVTNVVDRMSHSGIRKCYTKRCGKRDLSRRRFPCNSIIRAYKPRHRSHRGYACCFISHYFNWSCIPKFVSNFTFNSYTFTFHCYEPAGATGLNISQISPSVILSLTSRPFLKIKVRRYSCLIELRTSQVLKTLPLLSCCQQRRLLKRTTSLSVTALFGDMAVVEGGSKSSRCVSIALVMFIFFLLRRPRNRHQTEQKPSKTRKGAVHEIRRHRRLHVARKRVVGVVGQR